MFANYWKVAFRNLLRRKTYSILNLTGLGVGMACAILITLWVRYELSYDRFHENVDRLYRVVFTNEQKEFHGYWQPGPLAKYLKDNFPEIEQTTNYSEMQWKVSHDTRGFFCRGSFVDPAFFQMFSFPLEEGNAGTVLGNPNAVAISKSLAQKLFGRDDPIGKRVKLNDQSDLMVSGVFADVPGTSHIQFDIVLPFAGAPGMMKMWDRKCVQTYVLLRANASLDEINSKIYGLMNTFNPTWKNILYLFPMAKSHLYEPGGTGAIIYVYMFSVFGLLVLLVACINFINLSTARSERRAKEIGIRKTIGSTRLDLIQQFMIETLLLSGLSLIIAIVIVELSLPSINSILNVHIQMIYSGRMIFGLLGFSGLTGLIAGSYPAIYLSSFSPTSVLKRGSAKSGEQRSSLLRNALVVGQFSFSVFIITCVLFIGSQLRFIQSRNLGFDRQQILVVSTRGALQQKVPSVKAELLKLPCVESVAVSATDLTDFQGAGTGPIEWEGKNSKTPLEVGFNFVDEDFAKTLQVSMAQGRFFSKEYPADRSESVVVNEEAVREMGMENPINKNLSTWFGAKGRIIGVIRDFHTQSLRDEMTPVVFIPTPVANYLYVRISPPDLPAAVKSIETKLREIVPDDPFEYRFLDDVIDHQYKAERTISALAMFIAFIAIFISCLGLFGLASFSSEQRTKEVGIRKVLGASISSVMVMLTKDFTKWVVLANVIAWPIAWYAVDKWLQNFAYRIDITIWPFVLAGTSALAIAMFTVSWQAIRAATANPVESLRYE